MTTTKMDERKRAQQKALSRSLYGMFASLYGKIDWVTFGAYFRLVRRALDYIPEGGRVLEVGFGPGKLHRLLSARSDVCIGLDYSEAMCGITSHRLQRHGLTPRITRGSVLTLPYADNTFDVVTSTFAFSGFVDAEQAMAEMTRVVKPGGRVVLVDIALPDDGNRWGTFLARSWERMGDVLYDYASVMSGCSLNISTNELYGPGQHIRAVVGTK